ncbi:nucleoside deaminase [Pseudoclavibacter sp. VKM Ac-2867]|uniref:nucleoside deaminase n=1 Tax=Pseudoclavibacter sp. VKM Ac-2867 TaxID=2783829 RepID=UPI003A5C374E
MGGVPLHVDERLHELMGIALGEAELALASADVPIGAVVTDAAGEVIATAHNERELTGDPTGHAEVLALRRAAERLGGWRLDGCTLVVTLEPCAMCAGAILSSRVGTLVYGAWDDKAGAVGSRYDLVRDRRLPERAVVIAGVREAECAALVRGFFRD